MIDILAPPILTDNHLMCTQSGNIQDLAACSGHSPSCIIGSDTEPDSSSRQEYSNPTSLPSDMGLRYMTIPPDDVRFSPDSGTSHSPVYSIEPTVQSSNHSSALAFSPYTNLYHPPSLTGSTYSSGGSSYFSPNSSYLSMPDIKPRLHSLYVEILHFLYHDTPPTFWQENNDLSLQ
jgi:hypothetical protein